MSSAGKGGAPRGSPGRGEGEGGSREGHRPFFPVGSSISPWAAGPEVVLDSLPGTGVEPPSCAVGSVSSDALPSEGRPRPLWPGPLMSTGPRSPVPSGLCGPFSRQHPEWPPKNTNRITLPPQFQACFHLGVSASPLAGKDLLQKVNR